MVPGEGPQPAVGMIVGEAAHFEDDDAGRPFAGAAGRLLDTALRSLGLMREELYLTNVVKTVPVDDEGRIRRPSAEELEEWSEVFDGEVFNTAPHAILALGKTAAKALTGFADLPGGSKVDNVYTAWHPRYVLRNRVMYGVWLEQLKPWAEAVMQRAAA